MYHIIERVANGRVLKNMRNVRHVTEDDIEDVRYQSEKDNIGLKSEGLHVVIF